MSVVVCLYALLSVLNTVYITCTIRTSYYYYCTVYFHVILLGNLSRHHVRGGVYRRVEHDMISIAHSMLSVWRITCVRIHAHTLVALVSCDESAESTLLQHHELLEVMVEQR